MLRAVVGVVGVVGIVLAEIGLISSGATLFGLRIPAWLQRASGGETRMDSAGALVTALGLGVGSAGFLTDHAGVQFAGTLTLFAGIFARGVMRRTL